MNKLSISSGMDNKSIFFRCLILVVAWMFSSFKFLLEGRVGVIRWLVLWFT